MFGRARGLTFLLLSASPAVLSAQDSRELANMVHEMTECAAYLNILTQVPGMSEELQTTYKGMADSVGSRAIELTRDNEVFAARFQLALQRMIDDEMRVWDRLAVLNAKYGPTCTTYVQALRNPQLIGP